METKTQNQRLNKLVSCALLIAMEVVLTRFLSIRTSVATIGFGFVPLAVSGIMFGPVYGFVVGGVADLIGATLWPVGAFHPGFTLTTALGGLTYGLLLHRRPGTPEWSHANFIVRVVIAAAIVCFGLNLCLNTFWLTQLYDKGYMAFLAPRVVQEVVVFFVECVTINLIRAAVVEPLMRRQVHAR